MTNSKRFIPYVVLGTLMFLVVLVSDQLTKQLVLSFMQEGETIPVMPFFDITFIWNRGISFGLFANAESWNARLWITAISVGIVIFLIYWLMSSRSFLLSVGLGLMIGGAIGNIIDRVVFGAVIDFIHVFWGSYSWYVFNIADVGVSVGIGLMLIENFIGKNHNDEEAKTL